MVDSIRPAEREQAERIAAARGYSMSVEAGSDPEWLSVTFTRTSEDELSCRRAAAGPRRWVMITGWTTG